MVFKSSMIILFEVCLKGLKKFIYMIEVDTRESMRARGPTRMRKEISTETQLFGLFPQLC